MGDARAVLVALIKENLLQPGPKRLFVSYYRKRVYADLLPDGSIRFKDVVYQSPVPCALQMKRSLNPSLKTDAGWSSMFAAASGESLKDIKDRLNIRKRGPNVRTTMKEKKPPSAPAATATTANGASPAAKERLVNAAVEISRLAPIASKCPVCRRDATGDVAACSACHGKTHIKCAQPALDAVPSTPWFCDSCLTTQASGILEFLQQTRRILVEKIAAQQQQMSARAGAEAVAIDVTSETEGAADTNAEAAVIDSEPSEPASASSDDVSADATALAEPQTTALTDADEPADADRAVERSNDVAPAAVDGADDTVMTVTPDSGSAEQPQSDETDAVTDRPALLTPEMKFLALVDSLIDDVSSKDERMHLIANSTGATLVHLAKTLLVQLVASGRREIADATKSSPLDADTDASDSVDNSDSSMAHGSSSSRTSEVDALVKIFDLRHQILSSQTQFERTTAALSTRTETRLRAAESELMALEEARAAESRVIESIVAVLAQYDADLAACQHRVELSHVELASLTQRRHAIRSSNVATRFVPAYRLATKQMRASSDQLLDTVLLDKLRAIARRLNDWAAMEAHYDRKTASLRDALAALDSTNNGATKRPRATLPAPTSKLSTLFARVKMPPSRRLIERQIGNYDMNRAAIRARRAATHKTLAGVLQIAREEHLSAAIVDLTDLLHRKCRNVKREGDVDGDDGDDDDTKGDGDDVDDEGVDDNVIIEGDEHDNDAELGGAGSEQQQQLSLDAADEPERKKLRVDASESVGAAATATAPASEQQQQPAVDTESSNDIVMTSSAGNTNAAGASAAASTVSSASAIDAAASSSSTKTSADHSNNSSEEIPLSEASATLADLTPDEPLADAAPKFQSHSNILHLDEPATMSSVGAGAGASDALRPHNATTASASPTREPYRHESASMQSKFSIVGEDRKRSGQLSAAHLMDHQQQSHGSGSSTSALSPDVVASRQQQQQHVDAMFHVDFQPSDTSASNNSDGSATMAPMHQSSSTSNSGGNVKTVPTMMPFAPHEFVATSQPPASMHAPLAPVSVPAPAPASAPASVLTPAPVRKPTKSQKERQAAAQIKKDAALLQQQQQQQRAAEQSRQQQLQRAEHERQLLQQQQQQQQQRLEQQRVEQQQQQRMEQERQLQMQQQQQQQRAAAEQERQQQQQQLQAQRAAEQERQLQLQMQQQQQQQQRVAAAAAAAAAAAEHERQHDEEHALLNQALEVLKQQHLPSVPSSSSRKATVALGSAGKQQQQVQQKASTGTAKQPKQPKLPLPPPVSQQMHQTQQMQSQLHPFQRVVQPPVPVLGGRSNKDLSLHSPSQPAVPQLSSQLHQSHHQPHHQHQLQQPMHQQQHQQHQHQQQSVHQQHHAAASSHLQMLSQHQQQLNQHQQQLQAQRQLQHPLYGDMPKGLSLAGLSGGGASGNAQDMYVDHTQQHQPPQQSHHMALDHLHASHLSAADVMRPHDLAGTGAPHFGSASAASLRSSAFLAPSDARSSQQPPQSQQQQTHQQAPGPSRSYYGDDTPSHLHAHDLFNSQLGGHPAPPPPQLHQHLYSGELQQQQQHSRSILTDQDYQSHLLARHYRDQDMGGNGDPSGSDDVNMGQWN